MPTKKDSNDRRRDSRASVVAYMRGPGSSDERYYFVRDLSEAGAFVLGDEVPAIESTMKLSLTLRFVSSPVEIDAKVVRHGHGGFAVAFPRLSESARKHIREHLAVLDTENH